MHPLPWREDRGGSGELPSAGLENSPSRGEAGRWQGLQAPRQPRPCSQGSHLMLGLSNLKQDQGEDPVPKKDGGRMLMMCISVSCFPRILSPLCQEKALFSSVDPPLPCAL